MAAAIVLNRWLIETPEDLGEPTLTVRATMARPPPPNTHTHTRTLTHTHLHTHTETHTRARAHTKYDDVG